MAKGILKILLAIFFIDGTLATVCLKHPLCVCYCTQTAEKDMKIYCKHVGDITPIQKLLEKYPRVYSLRIIAPALYSLPSNAFKGHIISVLEVDAPLADISDDAFSDIFELVIVNFVGGHFNTVPNALSMEGIERVELVQGLLDSIGNQLQNNTRMTDVLLSDNKIRQVAADAFLNAKSLEYLNLSSNLLTTLDPDVFYHIHQLKSIDLSNNMLLTVDSYFNYMSPAVIKLYGNNLTNIDKAFHHGMWSTKLLDLGGNAYLNLSTANFEDVPNLTVLSLNDDNLEELDPYLLRHFRFLYKLGLNGNRLSALPKYFFLHTPHLSTLELSGNSLSSVEDIFPVEYWYHFMIHTHTLKTVELSANKIKSIRFGASAKSVLRLDLSSNLVEFILDGDFGNLTSLTSLNLSGNPLSQVGARCFQPLCNLRTLDLSSSNLNRLNHSVQNLDQLKELTVEFSLINFVDKDEFLGLSSLQTLYLKNNSLQSVFQSMQNLSNLTALDVSGNNLETLTLDSLPTNGGKIATLKTLWMAGNPWACDCRLSWVLDWLKIKGSVMKDEPTCHSPEVLQGKYLTSLNQSELEFWGENCPEVCDCKCEPEGANVYTSIDCTNMNLDSIPKEFPTNAKEIDLQNNYITSFDGFLLANLANLEYLNLENNSLSKVYLDLSPSLKELRLSRNNLTGFPINQWNASSQFNLLTLSRNPWICDCEAWEFRQWLIKHKNFISDVEEVRCGPEGALSSRIIIQLSRDEMCPSFKTEKIALTAVIVALALLFCLLCYIFRKDLAAVLYSCGCGCLKSSEEHDYSFDAFLLYADEDEDFALSIFAEGLEARIPEIKLFIPTRQIFLSNSPVNIQSSLQDCCKVIVLLSKEFLKNAQCMQLLKTSMGFSIQSSSKRMIFVLQGKGNIVEACDSTLKAVMNNSLRLHCREIFFWQKLIYSLPRRMNCRQLDEENSSLIRNEISND